MQTKDLQKKTDSELQSFIQGAREAMRQQRFAVAGSKGRDVKKMREDRRSIARALTELRSRTN
ncbi:MAG: 50S ribosomal protein L29 [Patescibacteria group bacterium]